MTESCSPGIGRRPGVVLALQGGGAHGAFTWGVLDRLLEDGLRVGAVCGVSSGAIVGTLLVQGLVRRGNTGARREMRRLWQRVTQVHRLSPLQNGPLERWLFGWDLSNSLLWRGWEMAMRLYHASRPQRHHSRPQQHEPRPRQHHDPRPRQHHDPRPQHHDPRRLSNPTGGPTGPSVQRAAAD